MGGRSKVDHIICSFPTYSLFQKKESSAYFGDEVFLNEIFTPLEISRGVFFSDQKSKEQEISDFL